MYRFFCDMQFAAHCYKGAGHPGEEDIGGLVLVCHSAILWILIVLDDK
jgi:hypothetical protein